MSHQPKKTAWYHYTGGYIKDSYRANFILLVCVLIIFIISAFILITGTKGPVLEDTNTHSSIDND